MLPGPRCAYAVPVPAGAADNAAVDRRRARLEPELSSARQARRLLRESLTEAGVARSASWSDDAELAVHELVANAVLHAHTPIEITIEPGPDRVRVEVRDFEPALPAARAYDAQATTGRGMGLVEALTDRCGARSLGELGKVVWFVVSSESASDSESGWDVDDDVLQQKTEGDGQVSVRLLAMPIRLWLAARQHHDAMLRELVLYLSGRDPHEADLVMSDRARGTVSRVVAQAAEALGVDRMTSWESQSADLEVVMPRGLGPAYVALQDALDLGERLAANGELLSRPGLPEIIEVRDWVCHQIAAQLAGVDPSPWLGTAHERFETAVNTLPGRAALPADVLGIRLSTRPVVAVDVANRIIAVSRPLAELLDWPVDDLVGRRVVTLIPPELREAHVAGFSRYLSTGEAHVLGVPLELPVLRRDGSRIRCRLKVEEAPGAGGEAMFVAWIDSLPQPGSGAGTMGVQ